MIGSYQPIPHLLYSDLIRRHILTCFRIYGRLETSTLLVLSESNSPDLGPAMVNSRKNGTDRRQ